MGGLPLGGLPGVVFARVPVHELSSEARVEAATAAHPVDAPAAGRVVRQHRLDRVTAGLHEWAVGARHRHPLLRRVTALVRVRGRAERAVTR